MTTNEEMKFAMMTASFLLQSGGPIEIIIFWRKL